MSECRLPRVRIARALSRCCRAWSVGLVLAVLALADLAHAQVSELDLALFRTSRGEDLTLVDGVVEFDPRLVRGGEDCEYELVLEVRDSASTAILEERWSAALACEGPQEGFQPGRAKRVVETFHFAVVPGSYTVDVRVQPAGQPESARRASADLSSLSTEALASDLILGRDVGFVDTTQAQGWTVKKGQMGIAADPYVVADPEAPNLAYYLEVYRRSEVLAADRAVGVIRRPDGAEVVRTKLAAFEEDAGSRPIAGQLSLAGLPPGDYVMDVELEVNDSLVTRSRRFGMAPPMTAETVERSPLGSRLRDYFFSLSDEELAELFDPITIWLGSGKDRELYTSLTPDGKRNFLTEYFESVAPKMLGEGQPPLELYLQRVRRVQERFGEKAGRSEQAGSFTDRGRIYMLRGEPDDRLTRAFPNDNAPPYEIWSYEVGRRYVYLFVDETGFDHYRLIFSTDPAEAPLPNWQDRVGRVALTELERYFGIRAEIRN